MESKVPTPTPVPRQTLNIVNKTQLKTRARRVFSQNHIWPAKSLNFLLLKGIGRYFLYFVYIIMCLHLCLQQDTNPNSFHLHSSPPLLLLCDDFVQDTPRVGTTTTSTPRWKLSTTQIGSRTSPNRAGTTPTCCSEGPTICRRGSCTEDALEDRKKGEGTIPMVI